MRTAAALCLLVLCGTECLAGTTADKRAPQVIVRSDYAVVAGERQAEQTARRVAALIDAAARGIARVVGTGDLRPVPAVVYPSRKSFLAAADLPSRSHVVGLAALPAGVIHIDGTGLLSSVQTVVPHEVAHVMVTRALGPALSAAPLWLSEGIAEYAAGERASQVDPVALGAVGRGRSLELADLDGAIRARSDDAGIAYAQSASLVDFLVRERGEGVIAALLRSLAAGRDFESSLQQETGWHTDELERAWRTSLSRRWAWPLLFESSLVWYGLMALLFLIGLIRHLRARRRRQDMPEQDW